MRIPPRSLITFAALLCLAADCSMAQDTPAPPTSTESPAPQPQGVSPANAVSPSVREKMNGELSLFFPLEKANVQILPQRFEFNLVDKDKFRIGNTLFDARLFEFRVSKGESEDKFRLKLKWPAGLLSEGEISIRDNIGKAIWIYPIDKKQISFRRKTGDRASQTVAELEGDVLPEAVFRGLQFVPYFQICVQKTALPTRISLCSKDFFIQVAKGRLEIRSRDSLRHESYVNINGNKVGSQGVIFLQSLSDVISMRVLLLSGATLDVDTRMKEVEFRDIAANQAKGRLLVSGIGAEPVPGHRTIKFADSSWRTEIPLARPVIYLRGEGDIPMRQEFILQGTVRDQSTKVDVIGKLPISTYNSSVNIALKRDSRIKVQAGDEFSSITDLEGSDTLTWTLLDLIDTTRNRRFLTLQKDGQKFTAAWDIIRYPRWDFSASLALPLEFRAHLRGWFENRNLGMGLDYQTFLTEWKKGIGPTGRMRLPIYWSIPSHYNFRDSAWGILLTPENYSFKSASVTGIGCGGFFQIQMPRNRSYLGQWNLSELSFMHIPMGGAAKLKSEIFLRSEFLYPHGNRRFWWWGVEIDQAKLEAEGAEESFTRIAVSGGLKWQF